MYRPATTGASTAKITAASTGDTSHETSSLQEWPLTTILPTKCSPGCDRVEADQEIAGPALLGARGQLRGREEREQHEQAE